MTTAKRYMERLTKNVDAFYAATMSFDEFDAAQRKVWDEVQAAGPAMVAKVNEEMRRHFGRNLN